VSCQGIDRFALLNAQGKAYFADIPPQWLSADKQGNTSEDLTIKLCEFNEESP
jgi:hypothetical protein